MDDKYYLHVGYEYDLFIFERDRWYQPHEMSLLPTWITSVVCSQVHEDILVSGGKFKVA